MSYSYAFGIEVSQRDSNSPPAIELASFPKGTVWQNGTYENELLFLTKGEYRIAWDDSPYVSVSAGECLLLTPGIAYFIEVTEDLEVVIFRPDDRITLREFFQVDDTQLGMSHRDTPLDTLPIHERIVTFLHAVKDDWQENGRTDPLLGDIKLKELFFLFQKYYNKQDILSFFSPMLDEKYSFSAFVYNNYHKVRTVNELAVLANSSVSSFCDKFKLTYGKTAYKWIMERKSRKIYQELQMTNKIIKEIAFEQGFSSSSQFSDYCKKHLGMSPNQIRKDFVE